MRLVALVGVLALTACAGASAGGGRGAPAGGGGDAAGGRAPASGDTAAAVGDAQVFLADYVRPDGRVARTDQGGDTVSEGQSYGLLLAEAAGDGTAAARIWTWTRAHLRRADGLLAFHALDAVVPDGRWSRLAAGTTWALGTLTGGGTELPPDWARADGDRLSATPAPGGGAPDVRYSFDAQRCPVWMAGTAWDARWAARVESHPTAAALRADGAPLDPSASPLAAVAAAAADLAAHRTGDAHRLLASADAVEHAHPTYYGAAWVALGRLLLTTDVLA